MSKFYDFDSKHIGPRIKTIQEQLKISTPEMAADMRVDESTIYKYIQGRNIVPINNCFFLIKTYRVNPLYLFFGDDNAGVILPEEERYTDSLYKSKKLLESVLDYTSEEERKVYAYHVSEILCILLKD